MAYPATPKTWVAGDVLTAAQLNAELRDALLGAFPLGPPDVAWTAYTPTLVQGVTVTKTVTYAKYTKIGRLVAVNMLLTVTGAGTAGAGLVVGLPVAAANATSLMTVGTFFVRDASTGVSYHAVAVLDVVTNEVKGIANGTSNFIGVAGFTLALAAGDFVGIAVTYESAT